MSKNLPRTRMLMTTRRGLHYSGETVLSVTHWHLVDFSAAKFCFYSECIALIWNGFVRIRTGVCTGLTHIFSFTSIVLRFLLDWNQESHSSEAARQAWCFASLRNTGCALAEAMLPSSGHSGYRTHPCPSWLQRAAIKLRGLTRAELYFSKTISTLANMRHRRRPSLFLSSFHHLPSDSCSKGRSRK